MERNSLGLSREVVHITSDFTLRFAGKLIRPNGMNISY